MVKKRGIWKDDSFEFETEFSFEIEIKERKKSEDPKKKSNLR